MGQSVTGYRILTRPGHPLADRLGRVREHRLVLHEAGIEIPPGFEVHHINGDRRDNRLENLEVLSPKEHRQRHAALTDDEIADRIRAGMSHTQIVALGVGPHRVVRIRRALGIQSPARPNTTVRDAELRCTACQEWKPDDDFPFCRIRVHRRERHYQCRACVRNLNRGRAR